MTPPRVGGSHLRVIGGVFSSHHSVEIWRRREIFYTISRSPLWVNCCDIEQSTHGNEDLSPCTFFGISVAFEISLIAGDLLPNLSDLYWYLTYHVAQLSAQNGKFWLLFESQILECVAQTSYVVYYPIYPLLISGICICAIPLYVKASPQLIRVIEQQSWFHNPSIRCKYLKRKSATLRTNQNFRLKTKPQSHLPIA